MNQSSFSQKFSADAGILQLMDDLGRYAGRPGFKMLGGGNPSHIPAVQDYFRQRMLRLLDSEADLENMLGNYPGPAGPGQFIEALANFFSKHYGWPVTAENIVLTNGSQTSFFYLFNMFSGLFPDGSFKKILLPLTPEYIGYEDCGLYPDIFVSCRPDIELLPNRLFKYHVNFNELSITEEIGAICVSRPTNPTGNVLTAAEMDHLSHLAQTHGIPFIVDNAYGLPFPSIIFTGDQPLNWERHIILCMSLSKVGLPGARTGIVIADKPIARKLEAMNAVISLAPGGLGGAMALEAIESGEMIRLSEEIIRPHYEAKARQAVGWLRESLAGLDFYIHKPEGAIFLWVWFKGLPITSQELYNQLKKRGVLIIPGEHFFPGLKKDWPHRTECIRLSYAMEPEVVKTGIEIIGEVVRNLFPSP